MSSALAGESGWERLRRNRLVPVGIFALTLLCVVRLAVRLPANAVRNDFAHYYLSSRLLLDGHNPYTTSLAPLFAETGFVFAADVPSATNPPALLWLFAGLAWLPARAAFWSWVAIEVVSLAVILELARRLLTERLTRKGWWLACALTVSSSAVFWHFQFSQVQLFLAALVLTAYALRRRGHETTACLLVAIAGLIKLYPFVLLPWFVWGCGREWHKRWQRVAAVVGFVAMLIGLTGVSLWRDFFQHGLKVLANCVTNHTFNYTVPSFVTNLGLVAYNFAPPPFAQRAWWTAGVMVGLVLIAIAYLLCWRSANDDESQFGLLSVAMLVGSVTSWGHYMVFLIFPAIVAITQLPRPTTRRAAIGIGILLICLNNLDTREGVWLDRHLYWKILINYIPLYAQLALGISFVRQLRSRCA